MMSMKKELIEERTHWFGTLTLENIEAVAKRFKMMLEGRRYTFVGVNDLYGPLPTPEVRTSQRLAPESSTNRKAIYIHYGDDKSWGFIGVNDTYGVWSVSTESDPEKVPQIVFDYSKITIKHYAPSGNKIIWVIALEDED